MDNNKDIITTVWKSLLASDLQYYPDQTDWLKGTTGDQLCEVEYILFSLVFKHKL